MGFETRSQYPPQAASRASEQQTGVKNGGCRGHLSEKTGDVSKKPTHSAIRMMNLHAGVHRLHP